MTRAWGTREPVLKGKTDWAPTDGKYPGHLSITTQFLAKTLTKSRRKKKQHSKCMNGDSVGVTSERGL